MRRLIFPLVLGLGGAAILVALGVWQLQRLEWKRGVLAGIEARIAAPAIPLPAAPAEAADEYRAVTVTGSYLPGEILVLASRRGQGPGFRVIAPFQTAEGRRILIDRGFLREAERGLPRPAGPAEIAGNLHWPDERDGFTPEPDLDRGLWFARDVPAMAGVLGTEPVMVVRRGAAEGALQPMPVDAAAIPNDHAQYAATWFGLALVWLGMTALLIQRITRRPV